MLFNKKTQKIMLLIALGANVYVFSLEAADQDPGPSEQAKEKPVKLLGDPLVVYGTALSAALKEDKVMQSILAVAWELLPEVSRKNQLRDRFVSKYGIDPLQVPVDMHRVRQCTLECERERGTLTSQLAQESDKLGKCNQNVSGCEASKSQISDTIHAYLSAFSALKHKYDESQRILKDVFDGQDVNINIDCQGFKAALDSFNQRAQDLQNIFQQPYSNELAGLAAADFEIFC